MRWIILFLAAAMLGGAEPLDELNAAFHEAYAAVRAQAFLNQGPVLVVDGDRLRLYRDQAVVAEAEVRPAAYHRLKAVAHVPLAVRLRLVPGAGQALTVGGAEDLGRLRGQLAAARQVLPALFPDPSTQARQVRILEAALDLVDRVRDRNRTTLGELDAYSAAMGPLLMANAEESAYLELAALDRTVTAWRHRELAADWAAVRVVIIGSHMARTEEVSFQFFSRLLGEAREGGRVVYAEEKWDPKDALTLLAGHRVDGELGRAFFQDPDRMHRDVLADGAKNWLDGHPQAR